MRRGIILMVILVILGVTSFSEENKNRNCNGYFGKNEEFDLEKGEKSEAFGIGVIKLNLEDLNKTLATNGHTTFNENVLTLGKTHSYKYNQFIFSGDCYVLVGFEDEKGTNKNYDSSFIGGSGMIKAGYDFIKRSDISLYPTIGLGFGGMYLTMDEKNKANFNEIMKNPSRRVQIVNYNLLVDFGIGLNKSFICKKKNEGVVVGVETGYTIGIPINNWSRGGDDLIESKKVADGPDFSMSGAYMRVKIGCAGVGDKK